MVYMLNNGLNFFKIKSCKKLYRLWVNLYPQIDDPEWRNCPISSRTNCAEIFLIIVQHMDSMETHESFDY